VKKLSKKVLTKAEVRGIIAKRSEGHGPEGSKERKGTSSQNLENDTELKERNDSQFSLSFT
jgi:hypothetical protein